MTTCPYCAEHIPDQSLVCDYCGRKTGNGVTDEAMSSPGDDPPSLSSTARAPICNIAGGMGFVALFLLPFHGLSVLLGPAALVLGLCAVAEIHEHSEREGLGLALFAIATGGITTFTLATWIGLV